MSVLEFMSVSAAADHGDLHPVARSAMERAQRQAGATFAERDGWLVPVSLPNEREHRARVGVGDLSHLAKWELRPAGEPPALVTVRHEPEVARGEPGAGHHALVTIRHEPGVAGREPGAGHHALVTNRDEPGIAGREPGAGHQSLVTNRHELVWYRISPRRALLLAEPGAPVTLEELRKGRRLVIDVTAALSVLVLAGPEAGTVIRRLTHLHRFPCGGEVAHVTAHVLQPQPDAYWIVAPQEYGHYLWEVAVDVASALGGGPVGVDAL